MADTVRMYFAAEMTRIFTTYLVTCETKQEGV